MGRNREGYSKSCRERRRPVFLFAVVRMRFIARRRIVQGTFDAEREHAEHRHEHRAILLVLSHETVFERPEKTFAVFNGRFKEFGEKQFTNAIDLEAEIRKNACEY